MEDRTRKIDPALEDKAAFFYTSQLPTQEDKTPIWWKVLGGTVFSIIALLLISLATHINNSIGEIRTEVRILSNEVIKKPDYSERQKEISETFKELIHVKEKLLLLENKKEIEPLIAEIADLEVRLNTLQKEDIRNIQKEGMELRQKTMMHDENVVFLQSQIKALQEENKQIRERLAVIAMKIEGS